MHSARGQAVAANVVDHKIPHRLNDALKSGDPGRIEGARKLFWDRDNWQALCEGCHNSHKQREEKSGAVVGCDLNGLPIDSGHHWRMG